MMFSLKNKSSIQITNKLITEAGLSPKWAQSAKYSMSILLKSIIFEPIIAALALNLWHMLHLRYLEF